MVDFIQKSSYFGMLLSLITYELGLMIQKRFKISILNPLLISVSIIIIILCVTDISYDSYFNGSKVLNWLLTPATVCLAIPLYEKYQLLKENWKAIMVGITSGIISCMVTILIMSLLFNLTNKQYITLLPKSITTAIGMAISEELGGYATLTVTVIIVTGIFGNIFAEQLCKLFKITNPLAKGLAIGTSSHALGTAKAVQMGDTEGAISSLSIAVCGLLTVLFAPIFTTFFT